MEKLRETMRGSHRRALGDGLCHRGGRRESAHTRALMEVNGSWDTASRVDVLGLSWLPLDAHRSSVVEYLEHLAIRDGLQPGISRSTESVIISNSHLSWLTEDGTGRGTITILEQ